MILKPHLTPKKRPNNTSAGFVTLAKYILYRGTVKRQDHSCPQIHDGGTATYWQIVADGALVDERDVAVGNVVVLLGPGGDIPELLRVLLHTQGARLIGAHRPSATAELKSQCI